MDTDRAYYLTRHLVARGYGSRDIARAVRQGRLVRPRHGVLVEADRWRELDSTGRHLVVARAVLERLGPAYALSHHSACRAHGFDLYAADDEVHVTGPPSNHGRREAGVCFHTGRLGPDEVIELDGVRVTGAARAVVESASRSDVESAVVVACSALSRGGVTAVELERVRSRFEHWPGMRSARLAIAIADPGATTVGEARSLHLFARHGLPRPVMQVIVRFPDGTAYQLDFCWPHLRHVGEFDGRLKYIGLAHDAAEAREVVYAEKRREDRIRRLGLGMTRWSWAELATEAAGARLVDDLRRAMETSRRLYADDATLRLVDGVLVVDLPAR